MNTVGSILQTKSRDPSFKISFQPIHTMIPTNITVLRYLLSYSDTCAQPKGESYVQGRELLKS